MVRPPSFEIHSTLEVDAARILVVGELDIATVPRLEKEARAMLARHARELIIDMSQLTFIDSSGLRLLIALNDEASAAGWTLGLIRPAERALTVFRITGADESLPFIKDSHSP
jgi:anti-anti-sigma factor